MVDGLLEGGVEFDGPLERGDGPAALAELETGAAEKIERLGQFLPGDAGLEMVDGLPVVAPAELDPSEGEIGQERLGRHRPRPFESAERLIPVPEIRSGIAEVDQGLEVGASEIEDPTKRRFGGFGLADGERRLADKAPEFVVARCGRGKIAEKAVDRGEIAFERARFRGP